MFYNDLQKYIHISKYARWKDDEQRRETWRETVDRSINFWRNHLGEKFFKEIDELSDAIFEMKIMPSMRGIMTAGKALERDNIALYNCTACAITHPAIFSEVFYILMNGCGAGFSVENDYIAKLPEIAEEIYPSDTVIYVRDSKIGWATALKELIAMLYNGQEPTWDLSRVRPAGSRLKVFGGRASGPEPLDQLFKNVVRIFKGAKGRKLSSIECHDIMCHIANTVIVGSVRRAALMSLSDVNDDKMRNAKDGEWWAYAPQRALSNNSASYKEKPDMDTFLKEWHTLYKSRSGERGIWNSGGATKKAKETGRNYEGRYLTNPCGETILRDSGSTCNLSSIMIRPDDTFQSFKEKVRLATIMGTFQSTVTNFRFLRKVWQKNQEEERLLGVSMTGIMDSRIFSNQATKQEFLEWSDGKFDNLADILSFFHDYAHEVNKEYAEKLGINSSGHVGVIKPEGTSSLLTGTSSGIHPRYGKYYIRRVRNDKKDPLSQLMIDQKIPYVDDGDKYVFEFYVESPEHAVIQKDIGAMKQLELWSIYKKYWCDGNPSQTVYYKEDEFLTVAEWVWKNWDEVGGLSFFPHSDDIYANAPLQEITKEEYEEKIKNFPKNIDWSKLIEYEVEDTTTGTQEFACAGGKCEIV